MVVLKKGRSIIIALCCGMLIFGTIFAVGYFLPKENNSKMTEEQRVQFKENSWWLAQQEAAVLYNEFAEIREGHGLIVGAWLGETLPALMGAERSKSLVWVVHTENEDRKKFMHLLVDHKGTQLDAYEVYKGILKEGKLDDNVDLKRKNVSDLNTILEGKPKFKVCFIDLNVAKDVLKEKTIANLENGGTYILHDSLFPAVLLKVYTMAIFQNVKNMRQIGTLMVCTKADKVGAIDRFKNVIFLVARIPEMIRGTGQLARECKTSTPEWIKTYYFK